MIICDTVGYCVMTDIGHLAETTDDPDVDSTGSPEVGVLIGINVNWPIATNVSLLCVRQ